LKRFSKNLLLLPACLLAAVMAAGCPPAEQEEEEEVAPAGEVVIGYSGPLSGPAAEYGQDGLNGIIMAVEDINAAGGIVINGQVYNLRVAYYDDMADPTVTMTNVDRLLDRDGAIAIFNMVYTCTLPMLEINREAGREFLIMAYTSVPLVEYQHANELAVWLPPPFLGYVETKARKAMEQGWRRCAIVVDSGAYGQAWSRTFAQYWQAMGGTITYDGKGSYYADTDFSTQITAAMATNPEFMLIGGPSKGTMLVAEQARELGFEGGFVFLDQAKIDWVAAALGENAMEILDNTIAVVAVEHSIYPTIPEFTQRYNERFVEQGKATIVTWEAAIQYTSTYILAKAMEAAGSVDDIFAIRAAINGVLPVYGTEFPYEFHGITDAGRLHAVGSIAMIQDGAYQPPITIYWWPQNQAEFDELSAWAKETYGEVIPVWVQYPPPR
jgi:branched-chain amino acid transport system substrate-binding protein